MDEKRFLTRKRCLSRWLGFWGISCFVSTCALTVAGLIWLAMVGGGHHGVINQLGLCELLIGSACVSFVTFSAARVVIGRLRGLTRDLKEVEIVSVAFRRFGRLENRRIELRDSDGRLWRVDDYTFALTGGPHRAQIFVNGMGEYSVRRG